MPLLRAQHQARGRSRNNPHEGREGCEGLRINLLLGVWRLRDIGADLDKSFLAPDAVVSSSGPLMGDLRGRVREEDGHVTFPIRNIDKVRGKGDDNDN